MQILLVIFAIFLAMTSGLPAPQSKDVEAVNPVVTTNDQPIVDTGVYGWGSPFSANNPFGDLFENLGGFMEQMRQQFSSLFKHLDGLNSTLQSGEAGSILPIFPDLDLSKGNTTSVIKVIDGHKVVINETEIKNEDGFGGGSFFKVRIVDVHPDSDESAQSTTDSTETEAESVSVKDVDSFENEIFKRKENYQSETTTTVQPVYAGLETFDEDEKEFPQLSSNSIAELEETNKRNPIDLSRDTYVNQLLADKGAEPNPDAEIFEVFPPEP